MKCASTKHPKPTRIVGTIDPEDGLMTLGEVGAHCPPIHGKPISARTLKQWRQCGLRSARGERLGLATVVFQGNLCTTPQAVRAFLRAVTEPAPQPIETPRAIPAEVHLRLQSRGLRIGGQVDRVG